MATNASMRLRDGVLIIKVDMNVEGTESSTGKSTILAQTDGRFEDLGKLDESMEGCLINMVVLGPPPKEGKGKRRDTGADSDRDADDDSIRRKSSRRELEEPKRKKRRD